MARQSGTVLEVCSHSSLASRIRSSACLLTVIVLHQRFAFFFLFDDETMPLPPVLKTPFHK